ncbi:MAG: uridine kinase [Bacilli bacterium]|nr:uridine kinase [Bacilli bacterium]MDD3422016.1 uridine kinase [Bacilli bacterium]MDD4065391.1 uridine kinase [Bacilli bacterium]
MGCVIIGIAGGSASGKTSVAERLFAKNKSESIAMIRLDDYYHQHSGMTYEERSQINYDHPDSFDLKLLQSDLEKLKSGKSIEKPIYDYSIHNRSDKTEVIKPVDVIILEGILTFVEPAIRDLCDIKIFVDTPDDIRFIRRLRRDVDERKRTVESIISQYLATVRPMHIQFVEPTKKFADIIIPWGGQNPIVIDIISSKISSIING